MDQFSGINETELMEYNEKELFQLSNCFNFYFMRIGVPVVSILGLAGNAVNFIVFTSMHLRKYPLKSRVMGRSANLGLLALSASNMLFCLLAAFITLMPENTNIFFAYFFVFTPWVISYFITTSTWLMVMMSGERYLAVLHPLVAKRLVSSKKTTYAIASIFGVCFFASLSLPFEYRVATFVINQTTGHEIIMNELYGMNGVAIRRIIWAVVFDFIPCIALCYFNACIICKILSRTSQLNKEESTMFRPQFKIANPSYMEPTSTNWDTDHTNDVSRKEHIRLRTHSNSSRSSRRINITLVAVATLFLFLVSPSEVLKFYFTVIPGGDKENAHILGIVKSVTNFMQVVNFSSVFLIYCTVFPWFKERIKKICA